MLQTARRALPLLGAAVALFLLARSLRGRLVAVEVAGTSMTPALEPGDYILVRRGTLPRDPAGFVVYLHGPEQRPMLKRVIGLPGESLRAGAHVEVNARPLLEPHAHGESSPHEYRGVHRLAADEYFVLGDHRAGQHRQSRLRPRPCCGHRGRRSGAVLAARTPRPNPPGPARLRQC